MLHRTIISFALITLVFAENNLAFIDGKNALHRTQMIEANHHQTKSIKVINCLDNCQFKFSFGDSLTIPSSCKTRSISVKCGMTLDMDYMKNTGSVEFKIDNNTDIDFGATIRADAQFTFAAIIEKEIIWSYECTTSDDCATKYFQKYISYYIGLTKQLQTLYDQLSTLVFTSSSLTNVEQCYDTPNTVQNCKNGFCVYAWADRQYSATIYLCEFGISPISISYGVIRTDPVVEIPKVSDEVEVICNIDKCNSPENGLAIRLAIAEKWGGVLNIHSALTNLITWSRYALINIFIIFIKFLFETIVL